MNIHPTTAYELAKQRNADILAAIEGHRRSRGHHGAGAASPDVAATRGPCRNRAPVARGRRDGHAIDVRGLRKSYGGRAVVDGIDLAVDEGEIFGILGPNGAGKTTTVECIGGLRRPDGGSIRVAGLDPNREGTAIREALGIQLQESRLPAKQTVAEALELYSSFYRRPRDWRELADRLGLAELRTMPFGRLSGGQKQRLSVALALIGSPRVAILDELTTGLDPAARREVWDLLADLRETGVTLLLVSHFMEEAERLCDRVVVIDHGRIIAADTPAGLAAGVASDQRMSFSPSAPFDIATLQALSDVHTVSITSDRVVVTGTDDVAAAVITTLHEQGIAATRLRIDQPSLDDAFLALTREHAPEETASADHAATGRLAQGVGR
jgi:ABC-2 type transport system ATP-binding protein